METLKLLKESSERLLSKALSYTFEGNSFDAVEIYTRKNETSNVLRSSGETKKVDTESKTEIAIRVVFEENLGSAVATSFDDETLFDRALLSLRNQISEPLEFPNEKSTLVDSFDEETASITLEEQVKQAHELESRVLAIDKELDLNVSTSNGVRYVYLCNSNGFSEGYKNSVISQVVTTRNKLGFMGAAIVKGGCKKEEFTAAEIKHLVKEHHLLENPVEFKGGRMPVIFSGRAMGSLMMRLIGGVNGGSLVKGISPLMDKLDEQLFSSKLTVLDDATLPYGFYTRSFDDEGIPAQKTTIVENGVLKSFMTTSKQAEKLSRKLEREIKATGNASKRTLFSEEIEDMPAANPTNVIVTGEHIPDEELIARIKDGIYVGSVMGAHTGNIVAGDFSLNIGSGFLIKDGKMVGKIQGAMIAGNIYDLFKNIDAIGTKYEVMNAIFFPVGLSPMVAFKEVNVVT